MRIALLVITSLFATFMLGAANFTGFKVGNDLALRQLLTETITEYSVTIGQEDKEFPIRAEGAYAVFLDYEQFVVEIRAQIKRAAELGMTNLQYTPGLPVSVFWGADHIEIYELDGEDKVYYNNPFFGLFEFIPVMVGGKLTISDADLDAMVVQINRNGVSLRFASNIDRARLTVTDRKTGKLVRSKDTDFDASEDYVWLGSDGDVRIEEQFLTRGGPDGDWDVRLKLNFENGFELTYDGSGDLMRTLKIDREGNLSVVGGVPSEVLVIETTTNLLSGSWQPVSEKLEVGRTSTTQYPSEPPRFFRIKQ